VTNAVAPDFRTAIADRLDVSHELLASRWLEELKRVVPVAETDIFPGDALLGQIPALIHELAAFLRAPAEEAIAANAVVTARATELGRLRHAQQASVHQVLREYRVLRTAVAQFITEEGRRLQLKPSIDELVELMDRFETAIDVLLQTTVDTFVAAYTETITRHTTQLEGFNRMITHELRQPLGIFQFAIKLLGAEETWRDRAKRDQILATAERNVTRMNETLGKLVALARSGKETESALVQRMELAAMIPERECRGIEALQMEHVEHVVVDAHATAAGRFGILDPAALLKARKAGSLAVEGDDLAVHDEVGYGLMEQRIDQLGIGVVLLLAIS
jgi:signal transduction histidine kinase